MAGHSIRSWLTIPSACRSGCAWRATLPPSRPEQERCAMGFSISTSIRRGVFSHSALLLAAWLLLAGDARAQQVHPCDEPPQTTPQKASRVGWCHDLRDDDGLPVAVVAFRV